MTVAILVDERDRPVRISLDDGNGLGQPTFTPHDVLRPGEKYRVTREEHRRAFEEHFKAALVEPQEFVVTVAIPEDAPGDLGEFAVRLVINAPKPAAIARARALVRQVSRYTGVAEADLHISVTQNGVVIHQRNNRGRSDR